MGTQRVVDHLQRAAAAEGEAGTWFRLVENLLMLAMQSGSAYRAKMATDEEALLSLRDGVTTEALPILARHRSAQVSPEAAEELAALLQDHAGLLEPEEVEMVGVAIGLATAIDAEMHPTFVARLRDRGEQVLEAGRAHYVHRYHPGEPPGLVRGQLNTDPAKMMAGDLDRTAHVRLASREVAMHQYAFDWDSYGRLAPLASVEQLKIAVCVPNVTLDEFNIRPLEDGRGRRFVNYGPIAPEHGDAVLKQLEVAADEGAHIVLFPEYTVPMLLRQRLAEALQLRAIEGRPLPVLVLAGTSMTAPAPTLPGDPTLFAPHMDVDRKYDNEACLLMPHGTPASPGMAAKLLHKTFPAVVAGYRENIPTDDHHQFRVFMTQRFAIAVLICMDAMNIGVLRQLEDMGVNLVLVPAMTAKTSSLVQHVCGLAATNQAVVAFGNAPAWWPRDGESDSRVIAAFHGPYEAAPGAIYLPSDEDRPWKEPAVWEFDVYNRLVRELQGRAI